eukprot:gene6985-11151_t
MSNPNPIYCVCLAEFHLTQGNTISAIVPKDLDIQEEFDKRKLHDIAFPDGSHLKPFEKTFAFINHKGETLYGIVIFQQVSDPNAKRGAVQKSIIIFSRKPYFIFYENIIKLALNEILVNKKEPIPIVEELYKVLSERKEKDNTFNIFGQDVSYSVSKVKQDEFPGASLIDLINTFGKDTMIIWRALVLEKRLLFVSSAATEVSNLCFASPMIAQPLKEFSSCMAPYVPLTDIEPLKVKGCICGSTNLLFESKMGEWYEFCGSVAKKKVLYEKEIKLESPESTFIETVMDNIKKGKTEQEIREGFQNFTIAFLSSVIYSKFSSSMQEEISKEFKTTKYYKNLLVELKEDVAHLNKKIENLKVMKSLNSDKSDEKNELGTDDSIETLISNFHSLKMSDWETQMDQDDLQRYQRALKILTEPEDQKKGEKKKYKFSVIKQSKEKQQEKQQMLDQLEKEKKEEKKNAAINDDKRKSLKKQASALFGGKKNKIGGKGSPFGSKNNSSSNLPSVSPETTPQKKVLKELINREDGFDYPPEYVEGTSPVLETKYIPKEYEEDDMSEEAQLERKREKIRRKTLKARPRVFSRSDSLKIIDQ